MGKNPADQFYWNDWARDLEEHPLEIEGAWIRICCKLWYSETRGQAEKFLGQWAKLLGVTEEKALEILRYLQSENIATIPTNLTQPNGRIHVICRRMVREEKQRESNRLRQRRYYHKHASDAQPNANLTSPSSSSSTSSSNTTLPLEDKALPKEGRFAAPSVEEISESSETKIKADLDKICGELKNQGIFPRVFAFRNQMLKHTRNPRAVLHVLVRCFMYKPQDPWAYCMKIMKIEDGNYNERDYQKIAHQGH